MFISKRKVLENEIQAGMLRQIALPKKNHYGKKPALDVGVISQSYISSIKKSPVLLPDFFINSK
jgi:hypothetical protein